MLGEKGQHLLLRYADTETDKRSYEEYTLAKQIYEDSPLFLLFLEKNYLSYFLYLSLVC